MTRVNYGGSAAARTLAAAVGAVAATCIVARLWRSLGGGKGRGGRGAKKDESSVLLAVVEDRKGVVAGPWAGLEVGGDVAKIPVIMMMVTMVILINSIIIVVVVIAIVMIMEVFIKTGLDKQSNSASFQLTN